MMRSHLVSTVLSAAVLAACGGGSSAPPAQPLSVSKGVVTAKGSLTVNGVQFATTGATVRFEHQPGTEADIKVGMVVKVKGRHDDRAGEATEIEFEDAARGQVSSRRPTDDPNVVRMGEQEIEVEHATEFEDNVARLASIRTGDVIRVSGVPGASGRIRATRIDKLLSSDFEVKGFVSSLAMGPPVTFTLKVTPDATSCIAVTLGAASLPAGVANGSFVEVRSPAPPAAGAPCSSITVSAIELEDARLGAENQEAEVEGLVTSGTSASFMVDTQAVVTNTGTRWENGTANELAPGVKVEAEGSLDAQGVLHATKVSFRDNIRLQDTASNVLIPDPADPRTGSFTLLGAPGITVLTDSLTDWRNGLNLNSVASGPVQVRGYRFSNSAACSTSVCVVATRVDSAGNDIRLILQGPVKTKNASAKTLVILDFIVATTAGTEYRDVSDAIIADPAVFFAAVVEGRTVVKARGADATALSGTTLTAERLELEGDR